MLVSWLKSSGGLVYAEVNEVLCGYRLFESAAAKAGDVASVCKCQSFNAFNSCRAVKAELGSEHFRISRNFVAIWAGVDAGSLHGLSRVGWRLFEIGEVNPA